MVRSIPSVGDHVEGSREGLGDALEDGDVARLPTVLDFRQETLSDTRLRRQLDLRHAAKPADGFNRMRPGFDFVPNLCRQEDLVATPLGRQGLANYPGSDRVLGALVSGPSEQEFILLAGEDDEFVAGWGLDDLRLRHSALSSVDRGSVPDADDGEAFNVLCKQHPVVADAKASEIALDQSPDVSGPGPCISLQLGANAACDLVREAPKGASRARRPNDSLHEKIADGNIALCYVGMLSARNQPGRAR